MYLGRCQLTSRQPYLGRFTTQFVAWEHSAWAIKLGRSSEVIESCFLLPQSQIVIPFMLANRHCIYSAVGTKINPFRRGQHSTYNKFPQGFHTFQSFVLRLWDKLTRQQEPLLHWCGKFVAWRHRAGRFGQHQPGPSQRSAWMSHRLGELIKIRFKLSVSSQIIGQKSLDKNSPGDTSGFRQFVDEQLLTGDDGGDCSGVALGLPGGPGSQGLQFDQEGSQRRTRSG